MKTKTVFFCGECGYESAKWLGKCPACGTWNSMVEEPIAPKDAKNAPASFDRKKASPKPLAQVSSGEEERFSTRIGELDRVLGGGIVPGTLILVGGDPGIGKSTLLLQMCDTMDTKSAILYVSGEESQRQIKMRADRLSVTNGRILLLSETDLDAVCGAIEAHRPGVVIIDSVQTVHSPALSAAPGSVSQVREVTGRLMRVAKENGVTVFLVGHVTKEGAIAGPKVLEHMVDCVLYFEGERHQFHRILRAVKNRFGSTNEIGVFEMSGAGLEEVPNPSAALLSGRPENASGSCVVCVLEGTRPVLAEIQALVSRTAYPAPRRMSAGMDYNRISLLMAVLEKRIGLSLSTQDAYVNVAGGLRIDEPASDLGVALAIASAYRGFLIPADTLAIGEVGLTGEIRSVNGIDKRISEGVKLGFKTLLVPAKCKTAFEPPKDVRVRRVSDLHEALNIF